MEIPELYRIPSEDGYDMYLVWESLEKRREFWYVYLLENQERNRITLTF